METSSTTTPEPHGPSDCDLVQDGETPLYALQVEHWPIADLQPYHRNPRRGNVDAIRESLAENGQYKPVVVNRGTLTGRRHEVLAGNHTREGALAEGWTHLWVTWVDVDDDRAARIVAADNRTGDLGDYDTEALAVLLSELDGTKGLAGTGYDAGDMDDLLAALQETAPDDGDEPDDRRRRDPHDETGGVPRDRPTTSYADEYNQTTTRTVVLTYSLAAYEPVVLGLAELAARYGVDNNSAVIERLVQRATAETGDQ